MQDKNERLKNYELNEVNDLTEDFLDHAFPTRLKEVCRILEVKINGIIKAYVCIDVVREVAIPHLWIDPVHRSYSNIMKMKDIFYAMVHPWCQAQGAEVFSVNCDTTDVKTTELLRTLGFDIRTINIAVMPIQEVKWGKF